MSDLEAEDVVLKLLHTADWHLGHRFSSFDEVDAKKLSRARLDVIAEILGVADSYRVDAVLCAGDLFDGPNPEQDWWEGLARALARSTPGRPIFLLPGNHDPLVPGSVWEKSHAFRKKLPAWVRVVDRDGFEHELRDDAVLLAEPCRSSSGERDLALALPARAPGDERIRIGLVHGTTFGFPGHETNFPIHRGAAAARGLDYLAIGDTHGYRNEEPNGVPTIYPGAPEATRFGEEGYGNVALVLFGHDRRANVRPVPVGYWKWREVTCRSLGELRALRDSGDLGRSVVRLVLDVTVTIKESDEVESIVSELQGTNATHGRVGILHVDRRRFVLAPDLATDEFPQDLPDSLRTALDRLRKQVVEGPEQDRAKLALRHLWKLVHGRA